MKIYKVKAVAVYYSIIKSLFFSTSATLGNNTRAI